MKKGRLRVAGIGPGNHAQMTAECAEALRSCDCIVGYEVYVDLVKSRFPGKKFITTPMRKEEERCRLALGEAAEGKDVVLICSGDAGVYGMSGLMYEVFAELCAESGAGQNVEISVLPGVTAALSGAALLGAPLAHDFAVISLSDLMTPWEKIGERLEAAARADFCIVIYNPMSRNRKDYLRRACDILMKSLSGDTPCGWARNIGREGESCEILTLRELPSAELDMFTTVFIGNSWTRILEIGGERKLVTPRGYKIGFGKGSVFQ